MSSTPGVPPEPADPHPDVVSEPPELVAVPEAGSTETVVSDAEFRTAVFTSDDALPPVGTNGSPTSGGVLEAEIAHLRRDLDTASARLVSAEDDVRDAHRRTDEYAAVARRQTEMADELHAENRTLRKGELAKALDPLIRGIARLADDLDRIADGSPTLDDVSYLRGQVDALLHDAGITRLRPAPGEPFDPQSQQAAGTVPTPDHRLAQSIAEVRRVGLRHEDGRMLRPTEVMVHRFAASVEPATPIPDSGVSDVDADSEEPV